MFVKLSQVYHHIDGDRVDQITSRGFAAWIAISSSELVGFINEATAIKLTNSFNEVVEAIFPADLAFVAEAKETWRRLRLNAKNK